MLLRQKRTFMAPAAGRNFDTKTTKGAKTTKKGKRTAKRAKDAKGSRPVWEPSVVFVDFVVLVFFLRFASSPLPVRHGRARPGHPAGLAG